MKKLLLGMTMASFVLACAPSATPTTEDPYADITKSLASYADACSDVAFADSRSSMDEVNKLYLSGKITEAADLYASTAQGQYDKAVADYADYKSRTDKANTTMQDQKSRLNALKSEGEKTAPAEYAALTAKVNTAHTTATDAMTTCDLATTEAALADVEAQIAAMEARFGTKRVSGDTYTVVRGDSLWKIAAKKYANPYFWPLIYWANNSSIKDPDLIYPNQRFNIESGSASMQADAEKLARTRGAWSLFDGK